MAKPKRAVRTRHTTKLGGVYLPSGTVIDIDEDEANDKLRRGLVAPVEAGEGHNAKTKPKGEALMRAMALKIGELNRDDAEQFTAGGLPHTKALGELLGFAVTAQERDDAVAYRKRHHEDLQQQELPAA